MAQDPNRFYDPRKINKWFFIASFIFLVSLVLMTVKDFARPWKAIQETFMALNLKSTEKALGEAQALVNQDALNAAQQVLVDKEKELRERRNEIRAAQKAVNDVRGALQISDQKYKHTKAVLDVKRYDFELLRHEHHDSPKTAKAQAELDKLVREVASYQKTWEDASAKMDAAQNALTALHAGVEAAEEEIKKIRKEVVVVERKKAKLEDPLFLFRNAPMIDFISPTLKVQQLVLENVRYDNNFTTAARVDRCITCHVSIDRKGFEDEPNPWKTHPNIDAYVGPSSPHPMDQTGCTVCHSGQGESVDFNYAAHYPRNEEQKKEWQKPVKPMWSKELSRVVNSRICLSDKYKDTESCQKVLAKGGVGGNGWQELHHWDFPMYPAQYTEAGCTSCHSGQRFVPEAPKLNAGMRAFTDYGCYGCHKVEQLGAMKKPAPSLRNIKGKLTKEWVLKWTYNPWDFNPRTRMPRFFGLENYALNDSEVAYQKEEAIAIVDAVWDLAETYKPAPMAVPSGNIANGKKLVGELGCLGCHSSADYPAGESLFAPQLSNLGSKLNRTWLVEWLKEPQRYHPQTKMPKMRLSTGEVADIADYLLSQRNKEFDALPVLKSDPVMRDEVLQRYLEAKLSQDAAHEKLVSMSEEEKKKELSSQVLQRYGCWGCHDMKGFETAPGIGAELTMEGSKLLPKFDFGLSHDIPHTRQDWVHAKIEKPRRFDSGRVLKWTDRLRMPQFFLREGDAEKLTNVVISWTDNSAIPLKSKYYMTKEHQMVEDGRRLIAERNCMGCHNFIPEGLGGDVLAHYEDKTQGPPRFNLQGEKLKPDWFKRFLTEVRPIRPWLKIRMPSYDWSASELNKVIGYFNAQDKQPFPWYEEGAHRISGSDFAQAEGLFKELACTSCHVLGAVPSGADVSALAPNLKISKLRLRHSWIMKWLEAPNKIISDTRMPAFWFRDDDTDPKSPLQSPFPKYFNGDAKKQIEMLSHYLYTIGSDNYWEGAGRTSAAATPPAAATPTASTSASK